MKCRWCTARDGYLNEAETLMKGGVSFDHPHVRRLINRAGVATRLAEQIHDPIMLDGRCPLDGEQE